MEVNDLIIKGTLTDMDVKITPNNCVNLVYTLDGERCSIILPIESFIRKFLDI